MADQLASQGKLVIVSALDGNFQRKSFANIADLIPLAEKISKLQALCACGADAPFTKRLVPHEEEILIGGREFYAPACRTCFN